ncbi:unnamed protein product [Penicillium nalgiovense]|uniref:Arginase n=1 Tax=Penicillium nalgiovense TaxID=60175 RepID=A0A9W4HMW3_PENNA|nr:unnamed protein product [Penicillium nalgiovense]CAG7944747.1 unnamed protein product [Penicillium nalgiovense]CAG7951673.1 unnamed protein product [Penicillium nalgiovense]CAG7963436.1 unnamed protein product [Penicillium nalgiovense]CAG8093485.1 unnamed protein product [Penicillium nalgiovense]
MNGCFNTHNFLIFPMATNAITESVTVPTEFHSLKKLGIKANFPEILPVDELEGEIGRSFELLRRISTAVTQAVAQNTFPLILSGNCMASVGAACGLKIKDLGFIYFDAHDDLDSPDVNENCYFDEMGLCPSQLCVERTGKP